MVLLLPVLAACPNSTYSNPPPTSRFYFPTGIAHVEVPGSTEGTLFVANANFDKRYQSGSISAVNLDQVTSADGGAMPVFGAPVIGGPVQLVNLGSPVAIGVNSFTGEMAKLDMGSNRYRLFVPSRSEGMKFQAVDATVAGGTTTLSCFPTPAAGHEADCGFSAPTTTPAEFEQTTTGVPTAPSPYGVSAAPRTCTTNDDCGDGRTCTTGLCKTASGDPVADLWVTHLQQADSPLASALNYRGYLVHFESDKMTVDASSFIYLGTGATNSAAAGKRWVYTTGRYYNPTTNLLRLVDRNSNVISTGIEGEFSVLDSRGIAVGSNEDRIYIIGRTPDVLMVVKIVGATADLPGILVMHAVPLPAAPNQVKVIPRAGRGDLLAISCSGAGVLAVYDEDVGDLVAQVTGIGLQPFGIDVSERGAGARLFVSDFNDGRVAVLDMPDLTRPNNVRIVAHVGEQQLCITRPNLTAGCPGVTP